MGVKVAVVAGQNPWDAYVKLTGAGLVTNSKELITDASGKAILFKFEKHVSQRTGTTMLKGKAGNVTVFAKLPEGLEIATETVEGYLMEFRSNQLSYVQADGSLANKPDPDKENQEPIIPFIKGKDYWLVNYFVPSTGTGAARKPVDLSTLVYATAQRATA